MRATSLGGFGPARLREQEPGGHLVDHPLSEGCRQAEVREKWVSSKSLSGPPHPRSFGSMKPFSAHAD
jgi:hypothetical protein